MFRRTFPIIFAAILMTGCFRTTISEGIDLTETSGESIAEVKDTEAFPSDPEETGTDAVETELAETLDYASLYRGLLDEYYTVIAEKKDKEDTGFLGIWELLLNFESSEALRRIGYGIMDISGDGIPELVIGSVPLEGEIANGTVIYAVHTVAEGEPKLLLEGRIKHSYRPLSDGGLLYNGADGAMYSMFGIYDLNEDGQSLVNRDYYFTFEKNEDKTEIGFFHNTTGQWDVSLSEELEISMDEFSAIQAGMMEKLTLWTLTPFSEYPDGE